MKKLRVTAVSYLNTKPLLYGIFQNGLEDKIDLKLDIPSECARKLVEGEVDMGLVPVAIIPSLKKPHIISDYCIGSTAAVRTVALFSNVPLDQIERIYLDYQSRTSVELLKILLKKYWKVSPELIASTVGFEQRIGPKEGALVIGDRTIEMEQRFEFIYDLGTAWYDYTGLPFVFAAWISCHPLDPVFIKEFNEALKSGINHIPQLIYLLPNPNPNFDLATYFKKNISYELDNNKKKALAFFLKEMGTGLQPTLEKDLSLV